MRIFLFNRKKELTVNEYIKFIELRKENNELLYQLKLYKEIANTSDYNAHQYYIQLKELTYFIESHKKECPFLQESKI